MMKDDMDYPTTPRPVTYGQVLAIIVLMVLALVLPYVRVIRPSSPPPALAKWEYMIASPPDQEFDERMAGYGREGWELVSARRATSGSGEYSSAGYEMIFKRPVR